MAPPNTQAETIKFTSPKQARQWLSLPDGFSATLFAAEPDVHQPIAAVFDNRGRLWVVECYTYSDRKTNYDMSLNDRVVIFEDKDQDGKFDEKTVFWDKGKKLTGIEIGHAGVWLTAAPHFIFIPDADQDDKPDGPPKILLDGFEDNTIRHNIVNGLRWGPDGWLYGRHGIQATSLVGKPGSTSSQRTAINCCIWRYHPIHHKFEVVAEGGTNPWGFDYDEHGEMFMINTVIGHLFHVVPGARYRRMYGSHFNPHTYQVIEQTADHFHWDQGEEHWAVTRKEMSDGTDAAGGGHAHTGLMIYQGSNWPEKYHNTLFTANFHGRRINNEIIKRDGNSYIASHAPDFMKTKDPWFRGVELLNGPDGGVYILDWSDIGECHEDDGIHRTSGRIFKIVYDDNHKPKENVDLSKLADQELIALLSNPNAWYFRKARLLIGQRGCSGTLSDFAKRELKKICLDETNDEILRLRALWTAYSANCTNEDLLLKCSSSKSEHIRAWSIRLITDGQSEVSQTAVDRIIQILTYGQSGLVRLYIAAALPRFKIEHRFLIAGQLAKFKQDASDRVQPYLIWYGIEHVLLADTNAAIKLAQGSAIPQLSENIFRRLTHEIDSNPKLIEKILGEIMNHNINADVAIKGMSRGLSGRHNIEPPKNWKQIINHIRDRDFILEETENRVREMGIAFDDISAISELSAMAANEQLDVSIRRQALESWARTNPPGLAKKLKSWLRDRALTTAVVRAAVHSDDESLANSIINQMKHMDPEGLTASIDTLCARESWALQMLDAIESGKIDRQLMTAYHARQLHNMQSEKLTNRLESVWGRIRATSAEREKQIADLAKQLQPDGQFIDFDPATGKQLFEQHCSRCHVLYGKGGNTGPDLTGSNRDNLNYLLHNIIDPSGSVGQSYRASLIRTADGRFITGLVLKDNGKTMSIQTPEEILQIDKAEIDEIKLTEKSIMPDGLLDQLELQQKADLFGYLMNPDG